MLEYFSKLNPSEIEKFSKFISSPYHNTNRKAILLFKYLHSKYPEISEDDLNKRSVYRHVYRNQKYNETLCRKMFSDFNLLFDKFLIQLQFDNDKARRRHYLLIGLRRIENQGRYKKTYSEIMRNEKLFLPKDIEYYRDQFNTEMRNLLDYKISTGGKEVMKSLIKVDKFANHYIAFIKMLEFQLIYSQTTEQNRKKLTFTFYKEVIEYVESNIDEIKKFNPSLYLLYITLMFYKNDNDKYILDLEKYYKGNRNKITGVLLNAYLVLYHNFYRVKIHNNDENIVKYKKIIFNFYNKHYAKDPPTKELMYGQYINHVIFFNAVNTGLFFKKLKWVELFINNQKKYLIPAVSKDVYNISKASLCIAQKDYTTALKFASQVSNSVFGYFYISKMIKAIVFYELSDLEGTENCMDNLKQLTKTVKEIREVDLAAIKSFNRRMAFLIKHKKNKDRIGKKEITILKQELESNVNVSSIRDWFYEKLEEINE
ncbi:MAG: hypothetical protein ABI462_04030 [Ignavibacteria bacterium]